MDLWQLPTEAQLDGKRCPHKTDFRQMLKLLDVFCDAGRPVQLRWMIALSYFFEAPIPRHLEGEAMAYLSDFLTCGDPGSPGPKLLDWHTDASEIIADINAVAGQEVRSLPYLHWWSFLSFFHGIRDGRLSQLVAIREKLRRGQKLEPYEQEYYRRNQKKVLLRPAETPADTAEKRRLEQLLS